jgi:hypothetical protein
VFTDVQADPSKYDLETDKYVCKLVKLEASTHEQYGPGVKWVFQFAHRGDPPSPIFDNNGDKLEIWQTTNPELTPGTKAGLWAAALLGREIQVGESGAQIARDLIGRYGLAMWGPNPRSPQKKKGIIAMEPYAVTANGKGKTAPKAEPVGDSLLTPDETAVAVPAGDF